MWSNFTIPFSQYTISYGLLAFISLYCTLAQIKCGIVRYSFATFFIHALYSLTGFWISIGNQQTNCCRNTNFYNLLSIAVGAIGLPFLVADLWISYGYYSEIAHLVCLACFTVTILMWCSYNSEKQASVSVQLSYVSLSASILLLLLSFFQENDEGIAAVILYHLAAGFIVNFSCDKRISIQELTNFFQCLFIYVAYGAILNVAYPPLTPIDVIA